MEIASRTHLGREDMLQTLSLKEPHPLGLPSKRVRKPGSANWLWISMGTSHAGDS